MTDNQQDSSGRTRVGHTKADPTDEYVGRGPNGRDMLSVGRPGGRGWLGNPFTVEDHGRDESIEKFRKAFKDKLGRDEEFRTAVRDLAGKTLGCWCQRLDEDSPDCHAEVIAEWADRLADEQEVMTDGGRDVDSLRRLSITPEDTVEAPQRYVNYDGQVIVRTRYATHQRWKKSGWDSRRGNAYPFLVLAVHVEEESDVLKARNDHLDVNEIEVYYVEDRETALYEVEA